MRSLIVLLALMIGCGVSNDVLVEAEDSSSCNLCAIPKEEIHLLPEKDVSIDSQVDNDSGCHHHSSWDADHHCSDEDKCLHHK